MLLPVKPSELQHYHTYYDEIIEVGIQCIEHNQRDVLENFSIQSIWNKNRMRTAQDALIFEK